MSLHQRKDFQCRVRLQESLQGLEMYAGAAPIHASVPEETMRTS